MEFNNNLWEYKESINRLQATPQDVEKVKQQVEYSNRLVKAHNVMKVLDLPDEQDNPIRKILLKQDDKALEELSKKTKNEILTFILKEQSKIVDSKKDETIKIKSEETQKEIKLNQDIKKIKSVFTPQILEKNSDIADEFQKLDSEKDNKNKDIALQSILTTLKDKDRLKSITDQLWWANQNNPEYLEFKNALLGVDSGFESYFNDLEKINSWNSLSTNEIIKWIEKESGWMMSIDLNSNTPMSKMSLIWSEYSFDEEIDKKALDGMPPVL